MFLIISLLSCDIYTPEEHAQKAALEQQFDQTCLDYHNIVESIRDTEATCSAHCDEILHSLHTQASVHVLDLQSIVKERDALGFNQGFDNPTDWECHLWGNQLVTMDGYTREPASAELPQ